MQPVIYNNFDQKIIEQLKEAGLYDNFINQMNRAEPKPRQIFVLLDKSPRQNRYYLYHRGFEREFDNGFSSITIENPGSRPEVVKAIEEALQESFTSEIQTLWVDDPQRRN